MTRHIDTDKEVIAAMIAIYCRGKHQPGDHFFRKWSMKGQLGDHFFRKWSITELCPQCRELLEYSLARLDHCPHGEEHRSCKHCSIHCYTPRHRQAIKRVMRYAGPRIIFRHPLAALRHLFNI